VDVSDQLTVSQAAAALGVSERTIRRRCASGKLQAELISTESGATWLIPIESLGMEPSLIPAAEAAAPAAASVAIIERPDQEQFARLESEIAQIKAFLAGQMSARIADLEAENARLRAELAAPRPQPGRTSWLDLFRRKPPQLPPGE
jgi:excisionase family DNA binding protein